MPPEKHCTLAYKPRMEKCGGSAHHFDAPGDCIEHPFEHRALVETLERSRHQKGWKPYQRLPRNVKPATMLGIKIKAHMSQRVVMVMSECMRHHECELVEPSFVFS